MKNFFVRLKSWEYWPFGIVQLPIFIYWFWLSIKARSFFFFSASNPGIPTGGMLGESKYEILQKLPNDLIPKSLLIKVPCSAEDVEMSMKEAGLSFPVVFKPDIGERGWMVKRIFNREQMHAYLQSVSVDFIVQELIDLPLEFGVFYRRYPDAPAGEVTSIVMKEMLAVTGDGKLTLRELIFKKERARLQWKSLLEIYRHSLEKIVAEGETIELVSIGNHCLGTKFINGNHLITDKLSSSFNHISMQVPGFFFGRYDLRTASLQDLEEGKVKILELNGCGAEPAHIYHPGFPLWSAWHVLFRHWSDLFKISTQNHKRGTPYLSFREAKKFYRNFKSIKK